MPVKLVLFYNQTNRGWTETYYSQDSQARAAADLPTQANLQKFVSFRSEITNLVGIRASVIGEPRNTWFKPLLNFKGDIAFYTPDTLRPDVVSTDAVIRLISQTNKTRRLFLRGLKDSDVFRLADGTDQMSSTLINGVTALVRLLNQLGWQVRTQGTPTVNSIVRNLEASTAGIGFTDVTLNGIVGALLGAQVGWLGVNRDWLPGWPRLATVVNTAVVDGNTVATIPYRWREPGPYAPINMRLRLFPYTYSFIESWQFERLSERKTGRPSGSLRGRSRAVVRAQ